MERILGGGALEHGGGDSPPSQWKMARHENNTEIAKWSNPEF